MSVTVRESQHSANARFTIARKAAEMLRVASRTVQLGVAALAFPQAGDRFRVDVRPVPILVRGAKVERKLSLVSLQPLMWGGAKSISGLVKKALHSTAKGSPPYRYQLTVTFAQGFCVSGGVRQHQQQTVQQ